MCRQSQTQRPSAFFQHFSCQALQLCCCLPDVLFSENCADDRNAADSAARKLHNVFLLIPPMAITGICTASQIFFNVSWLTSSASDLEPVGNTALPEIVLPHIFRQSTACFTFSADTLRILFFRSVPGHCRLPYRSVRHEPRLHPPEERFPHCHR